MARKKATENTQVLEQEVVEKAEQVESVEVVENVNEQLEEKVAQELLLKELQLEDLEEEIARLKAQLEIECLKAELKKAVEVDKPVQFKSLLHKKLAEVAYAINRDPIPMNGYHSHSKYPYAREMDITKRIGYELSKRYVDVETDLIEESIISPPESKKAIAKVKIKYTIVCAESGEQRTFHWTGYGDNQQGDYAKALKSAMTNCHTYALTKRLLSPTGNDPELDDLELFEKKQGGGNNNNSGNRKGNGNRGNSGNKGNQSQGNNRTQVQGNQGGNQNKGNQTQPQGQQPLVTLQSVTKDFKELLACSPPEQHNTITSDMKKSVGTTKSKFAEYTPAELQKAHTFIQNTKKSAQSN